MCDIECLLGTILFCYIAIIYDNENVVIDYIIHIYIYSSTKGKIIITIVWFAHNGVWFKD